MKPAALGFRAHSGWAALVVVAGDPRAPEVVLRERIEMADPELPGSKQPYHAAEELDLAAAERLLKRFSDTAEGMADRGIGRAIRELKQAGHEPKAAGILQASGRLPRDLGSILSSHALIHTADGVHFREALARASERAGLVAVRMPERALAEAAAAALRATAADLQARVALLGRALGPPWTADQKLASLLAWMLLAEITPRGSGTRAGPSAAPRPRGSGRRDSS